MRKLILSILTCFAFGVVANAQNVNIPDANFKAALLAHGSFISGPGISVIDSNGDGEIQVTEAQAYSGHIELLYSNVSDLTGLEAFQSITWLLCEGNPFTSIDVTQNVALDTLLLQLNQLTSLDVSNNPNLKRLMCYGNDLTSLNVANGNNVNLAQMGAFQNSNLTCIQHDSGFDPSLNASWVKDNSASWSDNCSGSSCTNIVNIPDANFKSALLNHSPVIDTDGDGEICESEAQAITGELNVANQNISDLTGIEVFENITIFNCDGNQITSLNVSANIALTELWCQQNNQLTNVDISNNTALLTLYCNNNNDLASLNVSANTNLTSLRCNGNGLSALDVSANINLTNLSCSHNNLSNLDLSNNTALTSLNCYNNNLTDLDISTNTALTDVTCHNNQLTSLNVANGNNGTLFTNLYWVKATNNPNLTCIQRDLGFDPTTATDWTKDATASWSDDCSGSSCTNIVNIPDANFKNALLDHGVGITGPNISVIDTDGDGEICESEALAYTGVINVYDKDISNLLGIEKFTALQQLTCSSNQLTSLDISSNTALITLSCSQNLLTSLNVANGNNGTGSSNLSYMDAEFNNNLTCIQHDSGFNPNNANWFKDATASWSDNCTAGINENNISFSIVPNPTSGMLKIDTDLEINSVEIFSTTGQNVGTYDSKEFNISHLESGVYLVKVLSNNNSFTTRIIRE